MTSTAGPLFAAILLIVYASTTAAFSLPETRRSASSATPAVSSASSPLLRISSTPSFMAQPYRFPIISSMAAMTRKFQLGASSINDGTEEPTQPQSQQVPTKGTDLKELASQIGTKSSRDSTDGGKSRKPPRPRYQLGVGKNMPLSDTEEDSTSVTQKESLSAAMNWNVPEPANKAPTKRLKYDTGIGKNAPLSNAGPTQEDDSRDDASGTSNMRTTTRLLPKGDEESAKLTKAVWDEGHFDDSSSADDSITSSSGMSGGDDLSLNGEGTEAVAVPNTQQQTITDYQEIDLSIPSSVYSLGSTEPFNSSEPIDLVWDLMRHEAETEAAREPLLVSFLYSTIINHPTLESALAFHLANRLSSPAMLSTQVMSLIREALDADPDFRRNLRADMLAVRDRDPACGCLPDVFLYFKGFHALQTYRVAHYLWRSGRRVLAHYLQSQMSQHFQIDIHPNATLGSGLMLDHGTGIVIGQTAHLGHNCSVLHHVTLGGSGKKGVDRHPKVGNGVLLGAGASVLGNIQIGDGCQVGAGTLVIEDLPPRSVAVGVPAKIIGRFVDVTAQPSIGMNQLGSKEADENIVMYGMGGI